MTSMEPERRCKTSQPPVEVEGKHPWLGFVACAGLTVAMGATAVGFIAAQPIVAVGLGLGAAGASALTLMLARSARQWEPAEVEVSATTVELGEVISGTYVRRTKPGHSGDGELKGRLLFKALYKDDDDWRGGGGRVEFTPVRQPDDQAVKFRFEVAVPVAEGAPSFILDQHKVEWDLHLWFATDGPDDVHFIPITVLPIVHHTLLQ